MQGGTDLRTNPGPRRPWARLGPDVLFLLLTNLAVMALALARGWKLEPLVWVYWFQNLVIGFFAWRRIKRLRGFSVEGLRIDGRPARADSKTRDQVAGFFLLHFGLAHLVYLALLLAFVEKLSRSELVGAAIGAALFLLNHAFSYRYNQSRDLASRPGLGGIYALPYARVLPMHLVILLGLMWGPESKAGLIFFLLAKTLADLAMHLVEHGQGKPGEAG